MFKNRTIAIATMHGKESVIAPLLKKAFNINCIVPEGINTDLLGTFSGEIERKGDPLSVLQKKCQLALELTGCDLAIASEGSFGRHPSIFFASADDELILLVDKRNNFELLGRKLSTNTNFNSIEAKSIQQAIDFAEKVNFPSHALILKNAAENYTQTHKGITDKNDFLKIVNSLLEEHGSVCIETDMRAQYNPTRMEVIREATEDLIEKMQSKCPSCGHPGYAIKRTINGLPCSLCESPTRGVLALEYGCLKCTFTTQEMYPNNKRAEDPMYCDSCNP
jgi:hypothetical protein